MSEPRTRPRRGWWIATGLAICLVAAALRMGLPIYRRSCALATARRLGFTVIMGSQRPVWLSRHDRWGCTNGLESVEAISSWHYGSSPGSKLSRTEIDELLSQINVFGELKRLDLSGTKINDGDLSVLEYFPKLESLGLGSTSITDDGLKNLEGSLNLRQLDLTGTQIDDVGLAHLASLTKLEELNLDRTRTSNAGLKHLARLPHLRELTVSNTAVTDAGLDELLKTHPALSVSDD